MTNRKLDAQLAKPLIGCEPFYVEPFEDWYCANHKSGHGYSGIEPSLEDYYPVPPSTADWNGAGLVIEKMTEERWRPEIRYIPWGRDWQVIFQQGSGTIIGRATHGSFPIAVALAALRALGIEVEA